MMTNVSCHMLEEHSYSADKNLGNIDEDERIEKDTDSELNPLGKLSNYLVSISEKLKNNENSVVIDKSQSNFMDTNRPYVNRKCIFYIVHQIGRYDFNV